MWHYPHLARLGFAALEELFAATVVDVRVFCENEPGEWLLDQRAPGHTQQGSGGEVGLQDQAVIAEGDIADRRQVVEIEIACPHGVQFHLRPPQIFVLHLQLDLVYAQVVQDLSGVRLGLGHPGHRRLAPQPLFGTAAQLSAGTGLAFVLLDRMNRRD